MKVTPRQLAHRLVYSAVLHMAEMERNRVKSGERPEIPPVEGELEKIAKSMAKKGWADGAQSRRG
jgi:hypothetical protein